MKNIMYIICVALIFAGCVANTVDTSSNRTTEDTLENNGYGGSAEVESPQGGAQGLGGSN